MPEIILIAGPNGAGKTSFAREYLTKERAGFAFINADEIARTLASPALSQSQRDAQAARAMLKQIDAHIDAKADFVIETTLASLTYAAKIPAWRRAGYRVVLFYLRLPHVEASINRVKRRVDAGGHDIPEGVIRRRFAKSLNYLDGRYKPIVDEWYVWDSLEGSFALAEAWATHG
jgi:predicted ABC-type ATPase